MKILRQGPEECYQVECPSCDSLLGYTKLDLIEIKDFVGNAWETEYQHHVGLQCLVCDKKFWTIETDSMAVVKRSNPFIEKD